MSEHAASVQAGVVTTCSAALLCLLVLSQPAGRHLKRCLQYRHNLLGCVRVWGVWEACRQHTG